MSAIHSKNVGTEPIILVYRCTGTQSWTWEYYFTLSLACLSEWMRDQHYLLKWFQRQLEPYRSLVKVLDMTSSWRNGMALCALIHHYRPDLLYVPHQSPPLSIISLLSGIYVWQWKCGKCYPSIYIVINDFVDFLLYVKFVYFFKYERSCVGISIYTLILQIYEYDC